MSDSRASQSTAYCSNSEPASRCPLQIATPTSMMVPRTPLVHIRHSRSTSYALITVGVGERSRGEDVRDGGGDQQKNKHSAQKNVSNQFFFTLVVLYFFFRRTHRRTAMFVMDDCASSSSSSAAPTSAASAAVRPPLDRWCRDIQTTSAPDPGDEEEQKVPSSEAPGHRASTYRMYSISATRYHPRKMIVEDAFPISGFPQPAMRFHPRVPIASEYRGFYGTMEADRIYIDEMAYVDDVAHVNAAPGCDGANGNLCVADCAMCVIYALQRRLATRLPFFVRESRCHHARTSSA